MLVGIPPIPVSILQKYDYYQWTKPASLWGCNSFNSTKVRLLLHKLNIIVGHHGFQFYKSTIITLCRRAESLLCLVSILQKYDYYFVQVQVVSDEDGFNSTKVRLLPDEEVQHLIAQLVFQFYKSTIITYWNIERRCYSLCFNSTKVRLLHWTYAWAKQI